MEDRENSHQQPSDDSNVGPHAAARVEDPRDRQPAGQNPDQQEGASDHTIRLRDAPTFDRVTRIIALIGLAATIGTLAVNYGMLQAIQGQLKAATDANKQYTRQADAAEGSLALAKSTSLSADRPFVFPNVAPFTLPTTPTNVSIVVNTINSGRSAALSVKENFKAGVIDEDEPAFDEAPCQNCNSFVISPGIGNAFNGLSETIDFTPADMKQEDIDAIRNERKRLYVLGRIDYKDTNNQAHKSLSCVVFIPKSNNFTACKRENANYAD